VRARESANFIRAMITFTNERPSTGRAGGEFQRAGLQACNQCIPTLDLTSGSGSRQWPGECRPISTRSFEHHVDENTSKLQACESTAVVYHRGNSEAGRTYTLLPVSCTREGPNDVAIWNPRATLRTQKKSLPVVRRRTKVTIRSLRFPDNIPFRYMYRCEYRVAWLRATRKSHLRTA